MNLGDGFARRKQISADIETWTNRLGLSGKDTTVYQTKSIDPAKIKEIIPGTKKTYIRNYSVEECWKNIQELIEEDKLLARRISITNQTAKAKMLDLDGTEKVLTIPELLVLRNEIAPKLENAARALPKLPTGVEILAQSAKETKWRQIEPTRKISQELSEKGLRIDKEYIDFYTISEISDYGKPEREVFDEIDKIHKWLERIKNAINEANKTELVEL